MKSIIKRLFTLSILFSIFACSQKSKEQKIVLSGKTISKKIVDKPQAEPTSIGTVLEETFIDSTQVGIKGKSKLIVEQFRNDDSSYVVIQLFEKRRNKWILNQKLELLKDGITNCETEIKDFNNDSFNDVTYKSSVAARGANEIRTLLIFDKAKKQLIVMKNSDQYPNLAYNKLLNCIDAWLVYGGSSTVFLKIEKDSLREFAGVSLDENEREVYSIDKNGKRKTISKEFIKDLEVYTRYKNYDPLIEDTNSE